MAQWEKGKTALQHCRERTCDFRRHSLFEFLTVFVYFKTVMQKGNFGFMVLFRSFNILFKIVIPFSLINFNAIII